MKDTTTKSDVNLPPKFYGDDEKWEGWYNQWRAYLQAKEWLSTVDHPEGSGAENFDVKINSKIYNIEQAAEFDGLGANKQLLIRYDGYSKQKLQSLKKCIGTMKHLSGTNMSNHIDKFEKICGQMVSCGFVPEQEEKIDWFLASVHERTHEAMHALHQFAIAGNTHLQPTHQAIYSSMFFALPSFSSWGPNKRKQILE